jgi:hypothetical protein
VEIPKVPGQRGHHRPDDERGQADLQQQLAAEPVGSPAQQRHRGDVAQQVHRDDPGDPLQLVNRDADVMHDVADDGDHDIGVQRPQQYREAARADRDPASRLRAHQLT